MLFMIYFVHVDVAVHIVEEELVVPPVEPVMRGTVVGAPHCERATQSKTKRARRRRRRRKQASKQSETKRGEGGFEFSVKGEVKGDPIAVHAV